MIILSAISYVYRENSNVSVVVFSIQLANLVNILGLIFRFSWTILISREPWSYFNKEDMTEFPLIQFLTSLFLIAWWSTRELQCWWSFMIGDWCWATCIFNFNLYEQQKCIIYRRTINIRLIYLKTSCNYAIILWGSGKINDILYLDRYWYGWGAVEGEEGFWVERKNMFDF